MALAKNLELDSNVCWWPLLDTHQRSFLDESGCR